MNDTKYAKVIDFGLPSKLQSPEVSTILLKNKRGKFAVPINEAKYQDGIFYLTKHYTSIPYNPDDFYLVEDLLDKQVIDITGKRMVRVNDVLLKENGGLKVTGIDVSFAGILRRLGLGSPLKTVTIPWSAVEAFDYQTGDIRIKFGKSNLNMLHPAELADILEEAGTKEREGIVEVLDIEKAADAIEEANSETQEAILEQLPSSQLSKILEKMQLSEIADVADDVNPQTFKKILKLLSTERAKRVEKLMLFPDDVAGGLMQVTFYKVKGDRTIGEILGELSKLQLQPESIIVTTYEDKLIGQVHANELINANPNITINKLVTKPFSVHKDESFSGIFRQFAHYNLRVLPVVDDDNNVIGAISIDAVMQRVEEEEERDDAI
ncbi:MAG TPA: CBS domain-containing protein [Candidatus Sulfotelmatobacter sp.]|nr:CBS domain-containing protein [Candidatus Sulfotelmatobacter sp.]